MASGTAALQAALLKKYPSEAWALAWEVGNGTGGKCLRHADAVAMGLWPSRGLELHGFELKASRTDWLKELKDPSKAESVARFCDRWWLVVTDQAIVREGELPSTWGLMELTGDSLRVVMNAKELMPEAIDRVFLAGLMRACAKPAARDNADVARREYERGRQAEADRTKVVLDRLQKEVVDCRREIADFEQAAGFRLSHWRGDSKRVGQIVNDVLAGNHDRDRQSLESIRETARDILRRVSVELGDEGMKDVAAVRIRELETERDEARAECERLRACEEAVITRLTAALEYISVPMSDLSVEHYAGVASAALEEQKS